MNDTTTQEAFSAVMKSAGCDNLVIETFLSHLSAAKNGIQTFIPEASIVACTPNDTINYEQLSCSNSNTNPLSRCAILKLNGGLGTTMGLESPKSLIPVTPKATFLDFTLKQVDSLRKTDSASSPLFFMNSFKTDAATKDHLAASQLTRKVIIECFTQNRFPKVALADFSLPQPLDEELLWNPPGHGDLYTCLVTKGILEKLLKQGIEYLFVSNIDNLGALPDERIASYLLENKIPFLMEVALRTSMDTKGGHLAKTLEGAFILRESSQCSPQDRTSFEDINVHTFFNTNNIWIHLKSLSHLLSIHNGILPLPLICNQKHLDPRDATTQKVIQFETAMGAAISLFEGASVMVVPRKRFLPVKSCAELLLLRSDCYSIHDNGEINPAIQEMPYIKLDPRYFGNLDSFESRFSHGSPSLKRCSQLSIFGDIFFGKNIVIEGDVSLINSNPSAHSIPDNTFINTGYTF